ncbi:MAG: 4Fe-4S binding protein [Magnetococcales bacterium]|nr:4Fe-4S binding protein [Magnetococcales bacterium]
MTITQSSSWKRTGFIALIVLWVSMVTAPGTFAQSAQEYESQGIVAPVPSAHEHENHGIVAPVPSAHEHENHGIVAPVPSAPEHENHGIVAPVPSAHEHGTSQGDHGSHATTGHGEHGAGGGHQHPGLPMVYVWSVVAIMVAMMLWGVWAGAPKERPQATYNLARMPLFGRVVRWLNRSPWPLVGLKMIALLVFLVVVTAGLVGTSLPERNLATFFVWNLWWPLVVVSVFFIGTAWCAICPWDTLATWLVRRRLWQRVMPPPGLNLKVPRLLRSVWPALVMFMGLTWLELGIGVTGIPKATALMALLMVILSLVSLLLFERKAFCRYFCPVGRTLGFYSRLAPIGVRAQEQDLCTNCTTMECYNGSATIEPCPTHLTIGRFSQNTFCISCGQCALSCPYGNVSWRLRPPGAEALAEARPMWDGAWFMLALLGITSFHGVTMMPIWGTWMAGLAQWLGETGKPIISFTLGMVGGFLFPVVVYALAIGVTRMLMPQALGYRRLFVTLPFSTLPLAFVYHLSHNLDHLYRETGGAWEVLANPLGTGMAALSAAERAARMAGGGGGEQVLFLAQTGLMALGVGLAVVILRHRGWGLQAGGVRLTGWRLIPMLSFIAAMSAANLWLMSQSMGMRF